MKKRTGEPWISGANYGALLPQFTVNLVVRDMERSLAFYREVMLAKLHYADPDFAAVRLLGLEMMLHADHTYDSSPWSKDLEGPAMRGLGTELRLLGMDPDALAERAVASGSLFREAMTRGHGWRETLVRDPDGYVWAVGEIVEAGQGKRS